MNEYMKICADMYSFSRVTLNVHDILLIGQVIVLFVLTSTQFVLFNTFFSMSMFLLVYYYTHRVVIR